MRIVPPTAILALALALALAASAALAQSAERSGADVQGKRLFLRCASCHAVTAGAPAKIGPNLRGVVGRKAGGVAGYGYSPAMKAHDLVWDEATLDRWLARPSAVVPGTSMAFAGLPRAEDRKALIAYLKHAGS